MRSITYEYEDGLLVETVQTDLLNQEFGQTYRVLLSYDDGQLCRMTTETSWGNNSYDVRKSVSEYVYDDEGRLEGTMDENGNLLTRYIYDD